MKKTAYPCRAFTLIELLIVIAIVLILISIALPNFLEAQLRSKIARTRSDMRSLATSIEMYQTEFREYPLPAAIMADTLEIRYPMPSPMHSLYVHNFLAGSITSPIPFIHDLVTDIFADSTLEPKPEQQYIYYQSFEYTRKLAREMGVTLPLSLLVRERAFGGWVMFACGPDLDRKDMDPAKVGPSNIYLGIFSPTNGVRSNGDIIHTQRNPSGPVY